MRRETGEKIIAAVRKMDGVLGELFDIARGETEDDNRKKMLREIVDLVREAHAGITMAVVRRFPDLHPDKLKT